MQDGTCIWCSKPPLDYGGNGCQCHHRASEGLNAKYSIPFYAISSERFMKTEYKLVSTRQPLSKLFYL